MFIHFMKINFNDPVFQTAILSFAAFGAVDLALLVNEIYTKSRKRERDPETVEVQAVVPPIVLEAPAELAEVYPVEAVPLPEKTLLSRAEALVGAVMLLPLRIAIFAVDSIFRKR